MMSICNMIVFILASCVCEASTKGKSGLSYWVYMVPAVVFGLCSMAIAVNAVICL